MDRVNRQKRQCAALAEGKKCGGNRRHQSFAYHERFGPMTDFASGKRVLRFGHDLRKK
jgi:hypothetical protein